MRTSTCALASLCCATLLPSHALAQASAPSWEASPDVYRVIGETAQYRIILGTWKPDHADNPHSHTAGLVVYLGDCNLRNHRPGMAPDDYAVKAGDFRPIAGIASHHVENIGRTDCQLLHIERK